MKAYHHGNLKKELIRCACKMCERDGYTKLSIRSLAKESNVSQTAPYRHFKTKEDLYAAIAKEGFEKLNKEMSSIKTKNSKNYLINCGKAYISFGLKNANTYDLMFGTAVGSYVDYPDLNESANKLFQILLSSFKKLSDDADEIVAFKCITLWSMVHGLVGIIRKVNIAGDRNSNGPMPFANQISKNLDFHLDKVITGLIETS
ncbi:MAG: TetR family transcriptional regulator [Gammaproteobacteria bacterium TMED226]|nr:MAG: TetR family transcriptional regulator [Gammaproteobacteria bacterium TMED226]|tara:strand:+ start:9457 stop:10065 length:609 start_codon:yes stop_codon:yes gene_type:complete